jgi:RecA-family ATPase
MGFWKGRRRIGLDFDGKDGRPGIENYEIMLDAGLIPADSLTFRTKSRGLHVVAEVEDDLWLAMNAVNWKGEGVEGLNLIERDGRTGVDIRGENGVLYTVGSEMFRGGAYKVERNARIAPLPAKGVAVFGSARKAGSKAKASFDTVPDRFEDDWSIRESIKVIEGSTAVDGEKHSEFYRMANEVFDLGPTPEWFLGSFLDHWPLAHTWTQDLEREVGSIIRQRMAIGRAWGSRWRPSVYKVMDSVPWPEGMKPANDDGLIIETVASWADEPDEELVWIVPGLVPDRTVTLLGGPGGAGKSLLHLQLGVSMTALNVTWLGMEALSGPVLIASAEDERAEIKRRLRAICRAEGVDMASLKDLHILPLAGLDAVMSEPDGKGSVRPTKLWRSFEAQVARLKPKLIGLDTLADVYAGDENVRGQVRQFVGMVRGLCLKNNCAAVLLGHPSLSGMNSGSGTSGSTAWENSVRSRLYMHRPLDEHGKVDKNADPDLRILETMKQNYAAGVGDERQMRWLEGRFVAVEKRVKVDVEESDDEAFLELLRQFTKDDRNVSENSKASNYAPKAFNAIRRDISPKRFKASMNRLFAAGRLRNERYGYESRGTYRLVDGFGNAHSHGSSRFREILDFMLHG